MHKTVNTYNINNMFYNCNSQRFDHVPHQYCDR